MTPRPPPAERGHGWTLLIRYGAPCLIYAAAAPFGAGWASSAWLVGVIALLTVRARAERAGRESVRSGAEGLIGLAYAVAALHLLNTGNTAAEVLATTMLGVGLFATLVRDYRNTRRLVLNVTPYLVVIVIMQVGAVMSALRHGRPELVLTIVAAPLLVGNIFMIMKRDLTAAHRKLSSAIADAQDAAREKADFLANMSHEIRTPLNAVLGYASLLEGGRELGARDLAYVRAIQVGGADLLAVVNDILQAGRLEAGKVTLNPRPTPAAEFLRESVHLLQPLAASKSLELRLELCDPLPDQLLMDGARLRQVLSNLIGNALKFTPSGEVVVRVFYAQAAHELAIEVQDTGVGVAERDLPNLFERFVQAHARAGGQPEGSGLGLSIARALVELMGGALSVTSTVGEGSNFRVVLPVEAAQAAAALPQEPVGAPSARLTARVLVVDDHPANRALIRTVLQSSGLHVQEAAGGAEAVRLAMEQRFDLILMDLNMPGMDGGRTTAAIRSSGGASSRVPVVAVSADVMPEQVRACLDAGLDDHLAKPISAAALLKVVHRWVADRGGAARPELGTETLGA